MGNKISPDRIANPVTILAWDGLDFYVVKCDDEGNLVIDVEGIEIAGVTIADGSDTALGAIADAVVAAGAAGTLSAKLRRLTHDLDYLHTVNVGIAEDIALIEGNIDNAEVNMIRRATSPLVTNVGMTNADEQYSYNLPANCMKFLIKCRGSYDLKLRFRVNGGEFEYLTIPAGMTYSEDLIQTTGKTLYFQCATAAQVVEIVTWN